ncbi:alpha/beta hydrolase [Stackebrandtia nassauensis]|uniref:TAP domain protein n=1 Tax=Stackebrandtia nassauensis (strain DSM 44728 / CIP 108903 / NRRL B-16338 / NBRC 102104 / LLR-40K-21) TaxID=446470 RepID=D3Q869_STANL|nr:alpha/beta hydrolase [Stackebrandtia nassauensis]ADD42443.1 TAP domain protein [Stackebrandtia nassauensis DSM 44728]
MSKMMTVAAAVSILVVAGCGTGGETADTANLKRFHDQDVDWKPCPPDLKALGITDLDEKQRALLDTRECASVEVPVDYRDPDGERFTLPLARIPAADPEKREGSLLLASGGPGLGGVDNTIQRPLTNPSLVQKYDLVGFDPRGVGKSEPAITCLDDELVKKQVEVDTSPDTEAEIESLVAFQEDFTDGCRKRSGDILEHVGTVNVARDLDIVREVLGDKTLNYYGVSYGIQPGAMYAELFPKHTGRIVLDAPGPILLDFEESMRQQTKGIELGLERFADNCVADNSCPLGDDRDAVLDGLSTLFDELDAKPMPAADGASLTEADARMAIAIGVYDPHGWPKLEQALSDATDGDPAGLYAMAGVMAGRDASGGYSNFWEANTAVNCVDYPDTHDQGDVEKLAKEFDKLSPRFGIGNAWRLNECATWPKGEGRTKELNGKGAKPILILGNTGDPDAIYAFAEQLAESLESARLLTYHGEGHGAYGEGNDCVDGTVDKFLLDGTDPGEAATCRGLDAPAVAAGRVHFFGGNRTIMSPLGCSRSLVATHR